MMERLWLLLLSGAAAAGVLGTASLAWLPGTAASASYRNGTVGLIRSTGGLGGIRGSFGNVGRFGTIDALDGVGLFGGMQPDMDGAQPSIADDSQRTRTGVKRGVDGAMHAGFAG